MQSTLKLFSFSKPLETGITNTIAQMRKLRLRKDKDLAQIHAASKQWREDLNLSLCDSKAQFLVSLA